MTKIKVQNVEQDVVFQRIKSLMETNKISYRELAGRIGMSHMGLYKSLNNQSIQLIYLQKIADALGVDPGDLFTMHPTTATGNTAVQILKMQDNARDIQRIAAQLERDLSKLK